MMLASDNLSFAVRIATVVVPIGVYLLLLGILNSRRHPQLLTGRLDFALLILALSPMFVLPVLGWVGVSLPTVLLAAAAVTIGVIALAPRGHSWVIYNMPLARAKQLLADALRSLGVGLQETRRGFLLAGGERLEIGGFPLLRNVSIRLRDPNPRLAKDLQAQLGQRLATVPAETSPAAAAMLLIATGMLIFPLTLMAERVPEIVRILTDLLD